MPKSNNTSRITASLIALYWLFTSGCIMADGNVNLRLSVGNSWQTRNDVQVPNTDLGTRFSLGNIVGEGPLTAARLEIRWAMNERHGIRVLLAPLSYTESVTLEEPVLFAGGSFSQDQATDATYKFNSWRIGYFYSLMQKGAANFRVGATLKIRDAEIRLAQGNTVSAKEDLGLVPLLYIAGTYPLNNKWTLGADLDGLAGGPGRAIDAGVSLDYSIAKRWTVGAEMRILDGGAGVDEVYNFARFNSASIAISTKF